MSAIGVQSQINKDRALWLSTIPSDVIHGNIICDTILANAGYISTLYTDNLNVSTLNTSTLAVTNLDVSGMFVSSIRGNTGFFSTVTLASDLSGGVGYVRFSVDASGIQVDGDPIRFDNLVYLTSTINIVQVSTIVDTDIFASNGYFSTLSTNLLQANQTIFSSIICQDLSGQNGSFDRLFVSSLEALDISGVASSNWSQYPTLNSSIIFQAPYILSNVGTQLYFAGQELTDASGGGIDWSYFNAQTDVSMNNFSLRGLSTLEYQDGGKLYSQTGNNLFYNGQPVQYGAISNVSQWANYPAVNTIQTGGFPISSLGNLTMTANSNIRMAAESVSTSADQGLDVSSYSDINLTAQNGLKGRINLTANPGTAGVFGEINLTANGGTVLGVGTGGEINITANTPLGFSNLTSAVNINAAGINSYAGAIPPIGSAAGYNFVYGTLGVSLVAGIPPSGFQVPGTTYLYGTNGVTTSSDFYVPNIYPYWNGLTTPPDMNITGRYIAPNLAQVYVNLSNVKSISMDATAQIQNARYVSTVSTVGQNANFNTGTFGTVAAGGVGASAGIFTSLDAGTISTSLVTAPQLSTIDIRLSTINGVDWQDISGSVYTTISTFSTLQTSTFKVGTINGSYPTEPGVSTIFVEGGIQFVGDQTGTPGFGSRFISSLRLINNLGQGMITLVSTNVIDWTGGNPNGFMRIGDGGAFDAYFRTIGINTALSTPTIVANNLSTNSLAVSSLSARGSILTIDASNTVIRSQSTINLAADYIITSTITANPPYTGEIFFDGQLRPLNNIIVLYNNNILFQDSTGASQYLTAQQLVSQEFPCFINPGGGFGSNLGSVGANAFYAGSGTGPFGAAKFYTQFPATGWGIDIIDADGTTLFESINSYDTGGFTFQTNVYGVSSITSYNGATGFDSVVTAPTISTQNLLVSTINGAPVDANTFDNQFSTLYVSSLNFSTSFSYGSNTGTTYPIFIEKDHAGGMTAGDAVAIAIQGHNLGSGAVRNQIEIGARGSGENYIMSVWPGQNLEELFIDATDLTVRDGIFSTIINLDPFGLLTTGGIKGPFMSTLAFECSTINGSIVPWTSTLGGVVSTFTVDGTTATTPQLIGQISFPYGGDYFLSQKVAFTKLTGGAAQDCHGIMLLNAGSIPTFPGGEYGMAALPYINENNASTFDTLVTNIQLLSSGTKNIYYYDPTGNNYTASLITDLPVIHFNPGPPAY